ncbi:hypothetical protein [Ramlibacter sp. AN1133]|uniref:hypothetical protein n=1 Tax=Ramlibacter sp. AN1133 TaxID=3133429 RepID=UPI0030BF5352
MAQARELAKAIAGEGGRAPLGYVCAFQSSAAPIAKDVFGTHAGLQAIQSVRVQDGTTMHLAFWNSREHHDLGARALIATAGAEEVFHGVAAPLAVKPPRWYQRIRLSTWLLSAVAILGALDALAHRYEQLFTAPNALVKFSQRKYEIAQDEKLAAAITVENLLGVADLRDVELALSLQPPAPKSVLALPDQAKPSILATKERTFAFELERLPPGSYTLQARVTANGGYLRWWGDSFVQTAQVRVFPLHPKGTLVATGTGPVANALAVIPTGVALRPNAVCEVSFAPGPRFQFEAMYTGDRAVWDSTVGEDGLMRAVVRWKPGATAAKTEIRRAFRFAAPGPLDWAKVSAAATVACSQEQEGK